MVIPGGREWGHVAYRFPCRRGAAVPMDCACAPSPLGVPEPLVLVLPGAPVRSPDRLPRFFGSGCTSFRSRMWRIRRFHTCWAATTISGRRSEPQESRPGWGSAWRGGWSALGISDSATPVSRRRAFRGGVRVLVAVVVILLIAGASDDSRVAAVLSI